MIVLLLNKTIILNTYLFVCGLVGLFLILVGFYSLHQEHLLNYNALLFNPILVLFPFIGKKYFSYLTFLYGICLMIYLVILLNKPDLFLLLPFLIANGVCCYLLYKKNY